MNLSPSQRNKKAFNKVKSTMPVDYMAIACFVTPEFYGFIPAWKECVKRAYPNYASIVIKCDTPKDKNKFAVERFLKYEEELSGYPFVLITDVDILIMPEDNSILFQHLLWMTLNDLKYYSNSINGAGKASAVHFLTYSWWKKTRKAREKYLGVLSKMGSYWGMDEDILAGVIKDSRLPMTNKPLLFNHHGLHLGAVKSQKEISLQSEQTVFLLKFMNDLGLERKGNHTKTMKTLYDRFLNNQQSVENY